MSKSQEENTRKSHKVKVIKETKSQGDKTRKSHNVIKEKAKQRPRSVKEMLESMKMKQSQKDQKESQGRSDKRSGKECQEGQGVKTKKESVWTWKKKRRKKISRK